MNRVLFFILFVFSTASAAFAGDRVTFSLEGDVVRIEPAYKQVRGRVSSRDCWEERVPVESYGTADRSYGGAVVGAVVGGLLGNQVGKGSGKDWATAAGAATGAIVGDNIGNDGRQVVSQGWRTERRCPEPAVENRVVGYDVSARLPDGQVISLRMDDNPGYGRLQLEFRGTVSVSRVRSTYPPSQREW